MNAPGASIVHHPAEVELFERHCDENGVHMGAKAWLVSARA